MSLYAEQEGRWSIISDLCGGTPGTHLLINMRRLQKKARVILIGHHWVHV